MRAVSVNGSLTLLTTVKEKNALDSWGDDFIWAIAIGRTFIHEEIFKEKEESLGFYKGK